MKKSCILCALVLVLLLSGCAQNQAQTYIGAETAKQLAVVTSGLTISSVETITADLTTRNGMDYYQVSFIAEGQSYQYDIDAVTGTVVEVHSPAAAADHQMASENQSDSSQSTAGEMISVEDAQEKALSHAGLVKDQVTFAKNRLEYENGRQVYDVEFYTSGHAEYDYEIDAYTGQIVRFNYHAEGYTASPSSGSTITAEKAKELALSQVPGAALSDIRRFETDYEDGWTEYEGKIVYNGIKYEFTIDGSSGTIRSWETEPMGS